MKKIFFVFLAIFTFLIMTGCTNEEMDIDKVEQKVEKVALNEDGDIVIDENKISEEATFLSYELDGVSIGFIAVRGTDKIVRMAFNTCQSCSPSPNAYFIQREEYLECQNCGSIFHVDDIGIKSGGCNPAPIEEMNEGDGIITISSEYAKIYKDNFENWNGPKA